MTEMNPSTIIKTKGSLQQLFYTFQQSSWVNRCQQHNRLCFY